MVNLVIVMYSYFVFLSLWISITISSSLSSIILCIQAVLSIDDDLVTPCHTLDDALSVWRSNKRALVGFSPRMHTYDIVTGKAKNSLSSFRFVCLPRVVVNRYFILIALISRRDSEKVFDSIYHRL